MFAIALDLTGAATETHHPRGVRRAYSEIADMLRNHGVQRKQGSLCSTDNEVLADFFVAIQGVEGAVLVSRQRPRHQGLCVEQWSDFTAFMKA